jgi:uncharacterized protein YaaQ
MKMIVAILKDTDSDAVTQGLTSASFRVTRVASTGGFFKKGTATLFVGVDDDKVEAAITVMREKTTVVTGEKRCTVFVVPVEQFEQI